MIKGYKLVYSPTSDKRFRYKVKLSADEASCLGVIKEIGPICGRPFKNTGSDFEKAFYVYGSSDEVKKKILSALAKRSSDTAAAVPVPPPPDQPSVSLPAREEKETLAAPPDTVIDDEIPATSETAPAGRTGGDLKAPPEPVPEPEVRDPFEIPPLNSKYTFANLYEGGFNRFLKQACEDIAKEFTPSYNPLFIWGGVGRGKTHLIQALGNFIKKHHDGKSVFYIQAQDLITMIQDALSSPVRKAQLLKQLGSADALLIDDIQFLKGEEIQDVFFLIFERAYQRDHQIVLTSDRSPKQLAGFADRLRSRFEWGLVNKLPKPDFNSRREILKMKIASEFTAIHLTEEMLDFIADKFKDNVRELEGVLKKLNIYHKLRGEDVSMESLKNIVSELLGEEAPVAEEPAPASGAEKTSGLESPPYKTSGLESPSYKTASPDKAKAGATAAESVSPPPPADFPPPPPEAQCPNCGAELSHIEMYDRWYCYSCGRYAPPEFGKGKFKVSSKSGKKDTKADQEKLAALEELRKLAAPQNKEPIQILEEKDIEAAPATTAEPEAGAAPAAETNAEPAPMIKFTREIQCAIFYPVRADKAIKMVTDFVETTVKKHRLHIKFYFIVRQEYEVPHINYSLFLNVLHTAKVKVAIVVGPPGTSGVNEDEFYEKLNGMFADEGLCFEYIAYKDIRQSYEYLNIVLDIANFGKQRLGYKMIKEEFHGGNIKKG